MKKTEMNEMKNYWINKLDVYKEIKEIVESGEYDENSLIKWSPKNNQSFGVNFYRNKNKNILQEFIPKHDYSERNYYFDSHLSKDIIDKCDYEIGNIEDLLKREYKYERI